MGGKNSYMVRLQESARRGFEIGEDVGMQKMWDYVQLVLKDPAVMGKNAFGRKRMEAVYEALKVTADKHHMAFTDHKEADYAQEKMDAELRIVWGEDLVPFPGRYPNLKQFGYDKPRKEWK